MTTALNESDWGTYVEGEVGFEFGDTLAPVRGGLLADQLDVEEGALARAIDRARGSPAHYTRRDIGDQILC